MERDLKGIARARHMRRWADRKGGLAAGPDGCDRSTPNTFASQADAWFIRLAELGYSPRSIAARTWALRSCLRWAAERDLHRPACITKPILRVNMARIALKGRRP